MRPSSCLQAASGTCTGGFEASLAIKGLLTSAEPLAGLGLLVAPNPPVARFVFWITHCQIAGHPTDTADRHAGQLDPAGDAGLPGPTQHFYAPYLLAHGGVKLTLVVLLWRKVVWSYPAAMGARGLRRLPALRIRPFRLAL
ncbi:MAG: DUF2127 domain-containing protein, partial [Tabrizicola sp.]